MAASESLCLKCGFCCDGTLFRKVPTLPDETERLRRRHLPLATDGAGFAQPCQAYRAARCDVYEDRPTACRDFRCRLLERYAAGEASEGECLSVIREVRALAESIRSGVPEGAALPLREILDDRLDQERIVDTEWRRKHAALLMDAKHFELLVRREFADATSAKRR